MTTSLHEEPTPLSGKNEILIVLALTATAALIAGYSLGQNYLWQDEAQTALLARTVLANGVPTGLDGENHLSQELGAEYGPGYVWCWHTWLPFYALAAFFAVFGESTFIARLPFVMFGVATVPATYLLSRELWRNRYAALAAAISLMLCVSYLILIRQCRWYSPAAFFSVMSLLGYLRLTQNRRFGSELFIVSLLLLFHTHYFYVVSLVTAAFAHCLLWSRSSLKRLSISTGILLILCAPWIVWISGIRYGESYGDTIFSTHRAFQFFWQFLLIIEQHVVPWFVLEIPLVLLFVKLLQGREDGVFDSSVWSAITLLVFTCGATICGLSLVAPEAYFRYLTPIIPCIAVLIGGIVYAAASIHWTLGTATILLVVCQYPLLDYVYELTHDFDGPVEAIVEYLQEHANEHDVVAILYGDMAVKFYTDLRVVGGLTGEDLSPVNEADWIILRRHWDQLGKTKATTDAMKSQLNRKTYEKIILDCPDTPFQNREEPSEHLFRTSAIPERVVIWRSAERTSLKNTTN